jgi:transcriptional regulator with XRE-family HTH domain
MTQKRRWPKGTWMRLASPDTLKALMAQRNFSLDRMARYAGCSKGMISHLTSGRKRSCSADLAINIAEALEVPLEILFVPMMATASAQIGKVA